MTVRSRELPPSPEDWPPAARDLLDERIAMAVQEDEDPRRALDLEVWRDAEIHREAAAFYHRLLTEGAEGAEARRYLEERDLPPDLVKAFQIGFAPNDWDGLMKRALKKGYTAEQLEDAGLVHATWRGREKCHFLNPVPIREISARWVDKFSATRADAILTLKAALEPERDT